MEVTIQNQIARISTNDPNRENFYDETYYQELGDILQKLEVNHDVKAIIFGAGTSRHFCSGISQDFLDELHRQQSKIKIIDDVIHKIRYFPKPSIVGINGGCVGIGLALVLAFDIRFCTDEAYFSLIQTEQSLIFENKNILNLFNQINRIHLNEMLLSERNIGGIEAEKFNIINKSCYDRETLEDDLDNIANKIVQKNSIFKL